jgi:hypothetical protein
MILLNTRVEQNYIQFDSEYYKQNDGIAMGPPTYAILEEIFIQYLEHIKVIEVLNKHHTVDYYRYVEDILIVYNVHTTNIHDTLTDFNTIHSKIHFTMETETDSKLNYLDLTITNEQDQVVFLHLS